MQRLEFSEIVSSSSALLATDTQIQSDQHQTQKYKQVFGSRSLASNTCAFSFRVFSAGFVLAVRPLFRVFFLSKMGQIHDSSQTHYQITFQKNHQIIHFKCENRPLCVCSSGQCGSPAETRGNMRRPTLSSKAASY